jgi:hypothetical protein
MGKIAFPRLTSRCPIEASLTSSIPARVSMISAANKPRPPFEAKQEWSGEGFVAGTFRD